MKHCRDEKWGKAIADKRKLQAQPHSEPLASAVKGCLAKGKNSLPQNTELNEIKKLFDETH